MKKVLGSLLCAACIAAAAGPVAADGMKNVLISPNPVVVTKKDASAIQYVLKANDKVVNLGKLEIIEIDGHIMVPVRLTSETFGFMVNWDGNKKAINIDNGTMQADLYIGKDTYAAHSSKAIGMTAPQSLGVAPAVINGSTYVPVDFYKIIFSNPDCVTVKDRIINITSGSSEPNSTQNAIGIPNPMAKCNTLEEARKAVGYDFAVPSTLPDGYEMKGITVTGGRMVQVSYLKGENRVLFRTAQGKDEISGDYNVYDKVSTISVGEFKVAIKGNHEGIHLAAWHKDGGSFSLAFSESVKEQELSTIITSIK
jgi:hypothetical protein